MEKAIEIIREVAAKTDRAILFHSASGKDSIALLDLMHPYFKEIVCAFMYTVKDMEHINRYIDWACRRYANVRFVQMPHYGVYSYIKVGFFGCRQNEKQRQYTLEQLTDIVRERTGIQWAFFGFKQSDSMNRRLMLRGYKEEAINEKTMKAYPLSKYKNADVMRYIEEHHLIMPESYGGEKQSAGTDITDIHYLLYLQKNLPNDLKKLYGAFPMAERLVYEYEQKQCNEHGKEANKTERDYRNKTFANQS